MHESEDLRNRSQYLREYGGLAIVREKTVAAPLSAATFLV